MTIHISRWLAAVLALAVMVVISAGAVLLSRHGSNGTAFNTPSGPIENCALFNDGDDVQVQITGQRAVETCRLAVHNQWPAYMNVSKPWTSSGEYVSNAGPPVCIASRSGAIWTLYDAAQTGDAQTECTSLQAAGWLVTGANG